MENRKELQTTLNRKIKQIKEFPRSAQKEVEKVMATKYNVKFGDTVDIFNEISPFSVKELNDEMLYKLMNSIREVALNRYESLDPSDLFVNKYFTEEEIELYEKPLDEETDFDIEITDWKQVSPNKYTIYVSIDEVIRWRNYNKLRFNPETQRDLVTIIVKGVPIKKLDINRKSVNEMKELRKKGLYFPVRGIININPDYFDKPIIKDGKMIIPAETHMDLIEGFHNYIAMCEVKDENPNYEELCEFDIMLLNVDDANRFILQMDKKNHFKTNQTIRMDRINQVNYIIDQLNKSGEFHLYGTINSSMAVFINRIITRLFDVRQDRRKAIELLDKITNNMNYAVKSKNHFDKPFDKYEWLIYLTATSYAIDKNVNFNEVIDDINLADIIKELDVVNVPTSRHYKLINNYLSEVINHVL